MMVAIILVNYHGNTDTLNCVNSILTSKFKEYRIVIIDNSSNEDEVLELCQCFNLIQENIVYNQIGVKSIYSNRNKQIVVLSVSENKGFAAANNQGIRFTETFFPDINYYWLLNNDTIIESNTLMKLMNSEYLKEENIGIIGTKLLFMDNPNLIQALGGKYNRFFSTCYHVGAYKENKNLDSIISSSRIDYVVGASMLVNKHFVQTVGYMEEKYFLYFEELDWILRGKEKGFDFKIDYGISVLHREGGSTRVSKTVISEIADVCQLRNRIIFTKRYYPQYIIFVLTATFLTIMKRFVCGQKERSRVLLIVYAKELKNLIRLNRRNNEKNSLS